MERYVDDVNSSELLARPVVGDEIDESSVGYDAATGLSLTKEKNRIIDPERGTEECGATPPESSSAAVFSSSEKSLIPARTRVLMIQTFYLRHPLSETNLWRLLRAALEWRLILWTRV